MTSETLSIIGTITGIVGMLTGIGSLIISVLNHQRARFLAVHEYLSAVESKEFIESKKYVYNTSHFDNDDKKAALVVNFFHHWGMLAKRKYLPLWVFDGATGKGACRLYERVLPYIEARRKHNGDPSYAEYYVWLYKKIKDK